MLLITLVENAIKHGLEPVAGGQIVIRARRVRNRLSVEVLDDGAGFAAAGNGGTGVGLVNVQRQLAARYAGKARLALTARAPRGVIAALSIPLPERSTIRRGEPVAA
jgi:LytS/YehU family sensor histidine kinase